jgi:hypothetical protein
MQWQASCLGSPYGGSELGALELVAGRRYARAQYESAQRRTRSNSSCCKVWAERTLQKRRPVNDEYAVGTNEYINELTFIGRGELEIVESTGINHVANRESTNCLILQDNTQLSTVHQQSFPVGARRSHLVSARTVCNERQGIQGNEVAAG